jgi:hypothetical protein
MADYEIVVTRTGKTGRLTFSANEVSVDAICWWDPEVVIDANPNGYAAWATYMATKKDSETHKPRPAIWLGNAVPYANGKKKSNAIFIHEGRNATWSDGCIVADRAEVLKIWNAIVPQKTANILVKVTDSGAS